MMILDDVQEQIMRLLADTVHLEVSSPTLDLFEGGQLDSLMLVDLIVGIERQFNVQISLEELEIDHFRSVARMAEFVARRKGLLVSVSERS